MPPVCASQDGSQWGPQRLVEWQISRHCRVVQELPDRRHAQHPQGDPDMLHRARDHVSSHALHRAARGSPCQQCPGHQEDKAQAADDSQRTEQDEPAQDRGTGGLEQGRCRRRHGATAHRLTHSEHERAPHPMPIDCRDVLPGDRIEAVRHRLQGDRQHGRILLAHRVVVVIHALALCIEHLDGTEVWGNPLTEPEGHPGRRLLEHGVRLGNSPEEVRMGPHALGQP
jgi:hypothetical protein